MLPTIYRRLSLRGKLYLGLGTLCLLAGLISVLAGWCLSVVAGLSRDQLTAAASQAQAASRVALETLQCRRFEKDVFLNLHDPAARDGYVREWRDAFTRLRAALQDFEGGAASADDRAAAAQAAADVGPYGDAMRRVLDGIAGGSIATPAQANGVLAPDKDHIRDLTKTAIDTAQRKAEEARQAQADLNEATTFFKALILIVTLAGVASCLACSYALARDLLGPIAALSTAARRVAAGDWYARVDLHRDDELGTLADCFNDMVAHVRERVGPVGK